MLRNPLTKWLWDGRRSLLGWTIAVVVLGAGYAAFWPTIDSPAMRDALENYPEALLEALNYTDIATPDGYLTATVYGLVVAILLVVYGVGAGARAIAGDEEAGTLDLVLAHPVSRSRVALQRYTALVVSIVVFNLVLLLSLLAISPAVRLDGITLAEYAAMHAHLVLFSALFAAVSYAVGAAFGSRAVAIAAGAAFGFLGYLANGVLPQVNGLEWTRNLSPFHWLTGGSPLRNGLQAGNLLIMLGLIVLLVVLGTWRFERRDVAV
jgi:ABC-2 type transport system permease protein